MTRGDLITVALRGDLGKPRPAIILQSNTYDTTATVLICPLTTFESDSAFYRVPIDAHRGTGLERRSQAMLDKITAHDRTKCGPVIGRLSDAEMAELTARLVALIGG